MKIIKEGKLPSYQQPWWIDSILTCPNCKCEFQLTVSDKHRIDIRTERHPGAKQTLVIKCPTEGCLTNVIKQKD